MRSAPPAPDYTRAAEAQAQASREITDAQTWANRPTQITPFGTVNWNAQAAIDPATGRPVTQWTQTVGLTPELQAALQSQLAVQQGRSDVASGMLDRVRSEFSPVMNWSQFTPVPGAVQPEALQRSLDVSGLPALDRGSGYYDRATDALLGRFALRAQPRFQRETEALETRLRNRGLRPGDEAYDQALRELRDAQQDAWTGATYDAIIRGGQEAARMFGMDAEARRQLFGEQAQAGQFANQAAGQAFAQGMNAAEFQARLRQQQIAEEMQRRGFTLNEINALLEGQQVGLPQMPSFMGAGRAEAPQYLNAAQAQYQSSLDAFNARNALFGSLLGAITSPFSFGFNFGR